MRYYFHTVQVPVSAHGTNPASAQMAGLNVVVVKTLPNGEIDMNDIKEKVNRRKTWHEQLVKARACTGGVLYSL